MSLPLFYNYSIRLFRQIEIHNYRKVVGTIVERAYIDARFALGKPLIDKRCRITDGIVERRRSVHHIDTRTAHCRGEEAVRVTMTDNILHFCLIE